MATPHRRKEPFLDSPQGEEDLSIFRDAPAKPTRAPREERSRFQAPVEDVPVMTGTHFHSLDEKGRIIIPAKLRPALTDRFWMMLDENDNVALYNYATGRDILIYCERLTALYPDDEFIAEAVLRTTGAAEQVQMEGDTWRVPISDMLRYQAQLDKEVVTVGVLNKAVLWSRERWEESQARRQENPEVRRVQAGMLRAAASGLKPPPAQTIHEEEESGARGTGHGRVRSTVAGDERTQDSSAGNGGRSTRILTLSQLGR